MLILFPQRPACELVFACFEPHRIICSLDRHDMSSARGPPKPWVDRSELRLRAFSSSGLLSRRLLPQSDGSEAPEARESSSRGLTRVEPSESQLVDGPSCNAIKWISIVRLRKQTNILIHSLIEVYIGSLRCVWYDKGIMPKTFRSKTTVTSSHSFAFPNTSPWRRGGFFESSKQVY